MITWVKLFFASKIGEILMLKQRLNKSIIKWVGMILYILLIIQLCGCMEMDSDKANHLLQAEDILAGNFFLSNWILTGVTFFTTDLIYYEIGELFRGITPDAVAMAGGLMLGSVFIISYFACMIGQKELKLRKLCFALLMAIPCYNYILHFRVHTGAAFLSLSAFILIHYIFSKSSNQEEIKKIWFAALFFCCIFGTIGDLLFIIECIIPILIICVLKVLGTNDSKEKKIMYTTMVILFLAVTGAFLWDKIFFSIGNADKNSYIGGSLFSNPQEWGNKTLSFWQGGIFLSMGDFWQGGISDVWNYIRGINAIVIAVACYMILKNIYRLVKSTNNKGAKIDIISGLLSCSVCMLFLVYLLTDMSQLRYTTMVPIACGIIFIRNIEFVLNVKNKKIACGIVVLMSILSLVGKIKEISIYSKQIPNTDEYVLIDFLREQNLESGYAAFFDASKLTVLSGNSVKVRHIICNDSGMDIYKWFAKKEWYWEESRFVIVDDSRFSEVKENEIFGITEDNVRAAFGEPNERYEVSKYIVLVYDKDLSFQLLSNL